MGLYQYIRPVENKSKLTAGIHKQTFLAHFTVSPCILIH